MPGENTRFDVGRATGAKVNHEVEGLALIEGRFFRSPGFQRNAQKTHDHCNQPVSSATLRAHSLPPPRGITDVATVLVKNRVAFCLPIFILHPCLSLIHISELTRLLSI